MTITDRAIQIREQLRKVYDGNKFQFDFYVSQYISGNHNKELRREIIYNVTGERKPLVKCGMHACADVLRNSFDQLQLF